VFDLHHFGNVQYQADISKLPENTLIG